MKTKTTDGKQKTPYFPIMLCAIAAVLVFLFNVTTMERLVRYEPAARDAVRNFASSFDSGSREGKIHKIAILPIENDIGYQLHDALETLLSGAPPGSGSDDSLVIMGRSALAEVPVPATRDAYWIKLNQQYGVDAVLGGSITEKTVKWTRAIVRTRLSLNKLPGHETIHAVSNLEGTALLPPPLLILTWLPAALALAALALFARWRLLADSAGADRTPTAEAPSHDFDSSSQAEGAAAESGTPPSLPALMKTVLALTTDVMVLSRQNNLTAMADRLEALGTFLKEELRAVRDSEARETNNEIQQEKSDGQAETGDEAESLESIDETLCKLLQGLSRRLENVLQALRASPVKLDTVESLIKAIAADDDTIRDRFRERSELVSFT